MKHAIFALVLFATSLSVFAQRHPGPRHGRGHGPIIIRPRPLPHPRPAPRFCEVVMTDRVNRVVRRYNGYSDWNGMCRDGLRQCNYDLQRIGMWGYRCATVRW